ncbi:penicillin-binding protein 2D [mine drainage metagenome]|uniref:peptidoglycan glycosyltransferase n=1 Tax=mine drainage metagenome TaxID=410659 RepID=A0A1J5QPZ7_9ZZZZ
MASSARPRGRQVNVLQALALLLAFLLVAGIGGVLAAGLVLPAAASVSAMTNGTAQVFEDLPTVLNETPLSQKSTIFAADGTVLATFYAENRIVVPLADISPLMQRAVIDTEDKRFYQHGGVDPTGILRAAVRNATTSGLQGASTLTQQYVKNVLIEDAVAKNDTAAINAARNDTISRKLREAKLAIALEQKLSKTEILTRYLNIAQFGVNVWGVEAASEYYFGHSAKQLTPAEAATLAGVTNGPSIYDPERNTAESEKRRNIVLGLMRDQGDITPAEYQTAVATPLKSMLHIQNTAQGCMSANVIGGVTYNAGFFCDYVTWVIRNDPAFGATVADRQGLLDRGGLNIHTTIDLHLQQIANTEVNNGVPQNDPSGVASSIVTVEPGTGLIKAMAENRTFNNSGSPGDRQTSVNYNTDSAYGASHGFQPGSSFKPFTLLAWLQDGHSLNETINGAKVAYNGNAFKASCLPGGYYKLYSPWTPSNAEGGGAGMVTALRATTDSINTAYMAMASKIDLCDTFTNAKNLGVTSALGGDLQIKPAGVIGGASNVSPLSMAAAYAALADNGTFCEPVAITSVTDANGKQLSIPQPNCRQVIDPKVAATAVYAMTTVIKSGTAANINWPASRPAAGKTGTSDNSVATWFVGFTPQLSTAVWTGFAEGNRPLENMRINGSYQTAFYGATISAPTWKRFMLQALATAPATPFPSPDQTLLYGARATVPDVTGQSPAAATSTLQTAGFTVTIDPTQVYSSQPAGTVASTNPAANSNVTRGSGVVLTLSMGPAPTVVNPPNNPTNPVAPPAGGPAAGGGQG